MLRNHDAPVTGLPGHASSRHQYQTPCILPGSPRSARPPQYRHGITAALAPQSSQPITAHPHCRRRSESRRPYRSHKTNRARSRASSHPNSTATGRRYHPHIRMAATAQGPCHAPDSPTIRARRPPGPRQPPRATTRRPTAPPAQQSRAATAAGPHNASRGTAAKAGAPLGAQAGVILGTVAQR